MTQERQRKIFAVKDRVFQTNHSLWGALLTFDAILIASLSILIAFKPEIFPLPIMAFALFFSVVIGIALICCFHSVRRGHRNKLFALMLKELKEKKSENDEDDESKDKKAIEKKMRHIFIGEIIAYVALVMLLLVLTIPVIMHVRSEYSEKKINNSNPKKDSTQTNNIITSTHDTLP